MRRVLILLFVSFTACQDMDLTDPHMSGTLFDVPGQSNTSESNTCKNDCFPPTVSVLMNLSQNCSDWTCSSSNCYCDGSCLLLNDCCIDSFASHFRLNDIENVYKTLMNPEEFLKRNHFNVPNEVYMIRSCSSCYAIRTKFDGRTSSVFVIDRCPDSFSGSDIQKTNCEEMDQTDVRNVFVSHNGNFKLHIVYRNIFCAFCHNVSVMDLVVWKMNMNCDDKPTTLSEIQDKCTITYDIPLMYGQNRKCLFGAVDRDQCQQTGMDTQDTDNKTRLLCSGYNEPILYEDKIYKNYNCLLCRNSTDMTTECSTLTYGKYGNTEASFRPGSNFQLMFSLTDRGLTWNGNRVDYYCGSNMVYDVHTHTCRKIICPNGLLLVDEKCVMLKSYHLNDSVHMPSDNYFTSNYIYQLVLETETAIKMNDRLALSDLIQRTVGCGVRSFNTDSMEWTSKMGFDMNISSTFVNLSSSQELSCLLECIQNISSTFHTYLKITIQNFSNKTNMMCQTSLINHVNWIEYIVFKSEGAVAELGMNRSIDLFFSRFKISFSGGRSAKIEDIFYCDRMKTNCSKLTSYNFNEYEYTNDTLFIHNEVVNVEDFYIEGDTLYVCIINKTVRPNDQVHHFEYVYFVCSIISVISLFVLIIVHVLLPTLLTLHGKNLVCFAISLLLGQLLILICNRMPHLVKYIVAVITHFSFLSAFTWMAVIAFDIGRKFYVNTIMTAAVDSKRRFWYYCVFGWGLPMVVIVVCVILEYTPGLGLMDYNGNGNCQIANSYARLVAQGSLILLSILFSLVCFIIALYGIEKSRRQSVAVTKHKQDKCICIIYTKLAVILGLTWVIGMIASNINVTVFTYINVILNGGQGFLVCIISLLNTKTLKEIRRKTTKSGKVSKSSTEKSFSNI